jgi:hypothetical protein
MTVYTCIGLTPATYLVLEGRRRFSHLVVHCLFTVLSLGSNLGALPRSLVLLRLVEFTGFDVLEAWAFDVV